jgi:hypothetical protein
MFVQVPVTTRDNMPKPNANKVHAYGPGLEPGSVIPGKPTNFIIDSSDTAKAPVSVEITNGKGKKIGKRPSIAEKGDGNNVVSYVTPLGGEPYEVSVSIMSSLNSMVDLWQLPVFLRDSL